MYKTMYLIIAMCGCMVFLTGCANTVTPIRIAVNSPTTVKKHHPFFIKATLINPGDTPRLLKHLDIEKVNPDMCVIKHIQPACIEAVSTDNLIQYRLDLSLEPRSKTKVILLVEPTAPGNCFSRFYFTFDKKAGKVSYPVQTMVEDIPADDLFAQWAEKDAFSVFDLDRIDPSTISIHVHASAQDVELLETLTVTYMANTAQAELVIPEFIGFKILSGPSRSYKKEIKDGNTFDYKAVSYTLTPLKPGLYVIKPATIIVDGRKIRSDELEIRVHE